MKSGDISGNIASIPESDDSSTSVPNNNDVDILSTSNVSPIFCIFDCNCEQFFLTYKFIKHDWLVFLSMSMQLVKYSYITVIMNNVIITVISDNSDLTITIVHINVK